MEPGASPAFYVCMTTSFFHRRKEKAANLSALQNELARQLRGRLDLAWSLPPQLEALLEELQVRETCPRFGD